jgi:hypothetical protein
MSRYERKRIAWEDALVVLGSDLETIPLAHLHVYKRITIVSYQDLNLTMSVEEIPEAGFGMTAIDLDPMPAITPYFMDYTIITNDLLLVIRNPNLANALLTIAVYGQEG